MTDGPESDEAILAEMLRLADRLCQCADPLLAGQYRHLKERIRALTELRECPRPAKSAP